MSFGRGKYVRPTSEPGIKNTGFSPPKKPCPFFELGLCGLSTACKFSHQKGDSELFQDSKASDSSHSASDASDKSFLNSSVDVKRFNFFKEEFPHLNRSTGTSGLPGRKGLQMAADLLLSTDSKPLRSTETSSRLLGSYGAGPVEHLGDLLSPQACPTPSLRRPISKKGYHCYGCHKVVPFLMRDVQCPYCYGTFVEEQETAESFLSDLEIRVPEVPKADAQELKNKMFYCHRCRDVVKANVDLTCGVCNCEFVEERTNEGPGTEKISKPGRSPVARCTFASALAGFPENKTPEARSVECQEPKESDEKVSQMKRFETKNRFEGFLEKEKNPEGFTKVLTKRQKKRLKQKKQKNSEVSEDEGIDDGEAFKVMETLVKTKAQEYLGEAIILAKVPIRSPVPAVPLDFNHYSKKELQNLLLLYVCKVVDNYEDKDVDQLIVNLTASLRIAEKLPIAKNAQNLKWNIKIFRSISYLASGRCCEAIEDASSCLSNKNPLPHQIRAEGYRGLGNENLAVQDTVKAINIDPGLVRSLLQK